MDPAVKYPLHRPEIAAALLRADRTIAAMATEDRRPIRSGRALSDMGEALDSVFLMIDGWSARVRTVSDGQRQIILMFLPGELCGIKALFLRTQPDAIEALADGSVGVIDRQRLFDAHQRDPDLALRLHWQTMEEQRRLHGWVVALGQGDAAERMAHMILGFRGRLIGTGAIAPDALGFAMPLTQEEMADHMGLSQVHVNRTVRRLREDGLATIERGEVRIADLSGLSDLASRVQDMFEQERPEFGGEPGRGAGS